MILPLLLAVAAPVPEGCDAASPVDRRTVARVIGRAPRAGETLVMGVDTPANGPSQVYAYARQGGRWTAYTPSDTQQIVASEPVPGGGRLILAWHTSGGPGEEFSGLLFDARGRLVACPSIPNPPALNRDERTGERDWVMEHMTLERIAIGRGGRGAATTSAEVDDAGKPVRLVFRYATADGGRTWSRPRLVSRTPVPRR